MKMAKKLRILLLKKARAIEKFLYDIVYASRF